ELAPDLVLLDVNLPDTDGFAVAAELTGEPEGPAVVITSTRDADDVAARVRACGARGFVPKGELSGAALDAVLAER
ncbi:MAG: response regulator, partial [Solirubrobacteraceae bacterium]